MSAVGSEVRQTVQPPPSANISVRFVPDTPPPAPLTKFLLENQKLETAKARTAADEGTDSLAPRKDSDSSEIPNASSPSDSEEKEKVTEADPEPELSLHPSTIDLDGQKPPSR